MSSPKCKPPFNHYFFGVFSPQSSTRVAKVVFEERDPPVEPIQPVRELNATNVNEASAVHSASKQDSEQFAGVIGPQT